MGVVAWARRRASEIFASAVLIAMTVVIFAGVGVQSRAERRAERARSNALWRAGYCHGVGGVVAEDGGCVRVSEPIAVPERTQ
jgi:flagellin-like protein